MSDNYGRRLSLCLINGRDAFFAQLRLRRPETRDENNHLNGFLVAYFAQGIYGNVP